MSETVGNGKIVGEEKPARKLTPAEKPGERVVVYPSDALQDGSPIEIVPGAR